MRGFWKVKLWTEDSTVAQEALWVNFRQNVLAGMKIDVQQGQLSMEKLIVNAFVCNGGDWHKTYD